MKRVLFIVLLISFSAAAAEVTKFEPRPAVVESGDNTYVGILLSEEEFRKILEKKIDTNAKIADCQVDQRVCKQMQNGYKHYISQLETKIRKNNSWFDRNRGTVGLLTGLVVGVGLSVGIVHAVYPQ